MFCEVGKQLYSKLTETNHERAVAEKEVQSGSRSQSEARLSKVEETKNSAALAWKRHQEECADCRAGVDDA